MAKFKCPFKASEIPEGGAKCIELEGKKIAIFCYKGAYYALDDTCPHEGGPLSEGFLEEGEVECPWHGARFSLKTGEVLCGPATKGVTAYHCQKIGEDLEVEI
ncbi:ferredoxin [Methylacidiphilum kamchatkense Kam1]|uniref:Ferredoxin n=1 Tax=Methylacidiphilum kamchatkense Kam1 TaxID=1202785 RepID=A0A0C1UQ70_9BACT|nr:non-heme iron oxygenase ferredoxin subunit [Methylacidiphilum kamchatkense]KIE58544.1 ferredoxin [Methylacidiphilum kamchatkense Kam1]QDQ43369.1 nitrite reductase (NADH) small subunit/3-phenylpropionate/trans-cinnamate dioxygenase ferredoxin subunit [Methylacidiphilum kamchatkense Kam1]